VFAASNLYTRLKVRHGVLSADISYPQPSRPLLVSALLIGRLLFSYAFKVPANGWVRALACSITVVLRGCCSSGPEVVSEIATGIEGHEVAETR